MTATLSPQAILDARSALQERTQTAQAFLPRLDEVVGRVAAWAWEGDLRGPTSPPEAALEAMTALRDDILAAVHFLFEPAVPRARSTPRSSALTQNTWPEEVFAVVSAESVIGRTLLAAAARWHLMMGRPVLPRMLAIVARVDQSRIHGLVREGVLKTSATTLPTTGRPGRRVKGAETRVKAASALRWLKAQSLAPQLAELLARPKRAS